MVEVLFQTFSPIIDLMINLLKIRKHLSSMANVSKILYFLFWYETVTFSKTIKTLQTRRMLFCFKIN